MRFALSGASAMMHGPSQDEERRIALRLRQRPTWIRIFTKEMSHAHNRFARTQCAGRPGNSCRRRFARRTTRPRRQRHHVQGRARRRGRHAHHRERLPRQRRPRPPPALRAGRMVLRGRRRLPRGGGRHALSSCMQAIRCLRRATCRTSGRTWARAPAAC